VKGWLPNNHKSTDYERFRRAEPLPLDGKEKKYSLWKIL